ncbi:MULTISPECIES: WxL domain-containing protein [unclassified Enterococcus]|uniref:WxL domain-containing protein n=1 Tax=unclassified Enterococcus TaxID=2608891 RepID=UPI001CE11C07|nr:MULTISPECIES: WxL domain-containing protein [unclassified Enterococcus]MCA5013656.1 WxL domain-containing protein [Enterococcus sp. S23]MCA5016906.1 WxL domain-containing protein [Enterococcus sp. S22(2020)]
MKKSIFRLTFLALSSLLCLTLEDQQVFAEADATGSGHISFSNDSDKTGGIQDPEHPETIVDPGPSPSTSGDLRIDFVPQLDFSANKISDKNMSLPVNAQLFLDNTPARGNFIQVTDERPKALGWSLQMRQETQFQNMSTANNELKGAFLSFDKSWANSVSDLAYAPVVSKEVIEVSNIGETHTLATAKSGNGSGSWSISFGASEYNPLQLDNTLTPRVDQKGEAVLDPNFGNQQIYQNNAITLNIPAATKIDAVEYTTVITWILSELP